VSEGKGEETMARKLIDLTQEIYNGMPVYPGHQRTVLFDVKTHDETRELNKPGKHTSTVMGLLMCDHGPTHVDAFVHIDSSPAAESIDQLPLDLFYTPAVCLDVSHRRAGECITAQDLENACAKANQKVEKGMTVLLYTGHFNRCYPRMEWLMQYPGLDREAMLWLAAKGVVNVGIDSPSIDSSSEMKNKNYPAHAVCREKRILNTENLAHLERVVGKRFDFIGLPLLIRRGTGSPIRAVAAFEE
jgi:kynurenine formamidase